jgi:uncharacterized protein (TIGR00369 family)
VASPWRRSEARRDEEFPVTAQALRRDPYAGFREGLGISGQPIPIIGTTGCEVLDAAPEGVLVRLPVTRALLGQDGRLLPGALAIVADVACGWAAHAAQQHAGFASTAQLRLEFVRPLPELGAAVVVRATCDSATADAGLARGEIVDDGDELLAVCSVRTIPLATHRGAAGVAKAVASVGTIDLANTPLANVLGLATSHSADGKSTLELRPDLAIANSAGAVHGGALALIGYLAASEAQRSVLAAGEELDALDLVINYYRAVPADGSPLTCTAAVAHRGRRFLVAEGHLVTADGRIAARVSCGAQVRSARSVTRSSTERQ